MKLSAVAACAMLSLPLMTNAATHCTGYVQDVLLYADGTVNVLGSWRGDFTVFCNTNGTAGIPAEVCLSWYATAVKAAADNEILRVYYHQDFSCSALPTYGSAPVPVYVGISRQ